MLRRASLVLATSATLAAGAAGKPGSGPPGDLNIRLGETAAMTINGQPVRFRIAPDAVSVATLNGDAARRIGLKPSMIGYVYVIGPVRIGFQTDNARYGAGDASFRSRTAFSDRQVVDGADGVAGPATFPFRRTILTLREPRPGDRAISFPLNKDMGRSQTGVKIAVDGRPVYVAFSLDRRESLVTATGGQWIANAHGGRFDGEAREAPILYRVSRPVRSLRLQRPLKLGELEIRNLAVRVSDMGNAQGIADGTEPDPNEIVVTADGKRKIPNQRLYIGMDTIGHCASITYDFAAGTVTLMCPAQPGATRAN
jgi:hypothetical protein